ncbi:MAG: hypothetical protein Q9220_002834 [cf. Caloplaca sp. 1 TL-2023]
MADFDRDDDREHRESPFQTLAKRVAELKVQTGDDDPTMLEDNEPNGVETIESLCMNCEENGETRLLLTKIPFFREITIMSFSCDHCGYSNTDVQSAGQIQERGARFTLKATGPDDLERQIVKSDIAICRIEDLDITTPCKGQLTNIEGILCDVLRDLEAGQRTRKKEDPELYKKMDAIIQPLLKMSLNQNFPFTVTLDDPSGNSWIEPSAKDKDHKYQKVEYPRTPEQNEALGLGSGDTTQPQFTEYRDPTPSSAILSPSTSSEGPPVAHIIPQITTSSADPTSDDPDPDPSALEDVDILAGQSYSLPTPCPGCTKPAHLNLQLVDIPYFKQVVVSAVVCTICNYRSSDVKTGGEVPLKGKRIWLDVTEVRDLSRDILKSESCCLRIEEIGVEVSPGSMAGRFTTVEGLLSQIRDDMRSTVFDIDDDEEEPATFKGGDSMAPGKKIAWDTFFGKLDRAIKGELKYTVLMEDPLAGSYVQSFHAPDPDPKIREEEYVRSAEEDEELGISDMRTQAGEGREYEKETFGEVGRQGESKNEGAAVTAASAEEKKGPEMAGR